MNQIAKQLLPYMSAAEFLLWPGDGRAKRYQLIDGEVRPMAPASRIHAVIQANLAYFLVSAVRKASLPYPVLTEGAIIPKLGASNNVRVPDLVVGPDDDQKGDQVACNPVVMVEILSPGNTHDTRDNVRSYMSLPSVREIVVVHSDRIKAEVHRRSASGDWEAEPEMVGAGQALFVRSVRLEIGIDEVYANTWLTRDERQTS
jgi:Uma2 family endonuclease